MTPWNPQSVFLTHKGVNNTSRGLSPGLWQNMRSQLSSTDGGSGFFIYDDFLVTGQTVAVASNVGCYASLAGQYKSYEGASAAIAQLETAGAGGFLKMSTPASDNILCAICQGGAGTSAATSVLGAINRATSPKMVIFETRFKVSSIADDVMAVFLGLMEENGAVVGGLVDDTGVTIDNDYIGFNTVHTNGGTTGTNAKLRAVYKKDGQTAQTSVATAATLVADTFIKAGFVYDPLADATQRITWYVDNTPLGTYVTDTQMAAATFPDGEEMGFTAMTKSGTATASNLVIDWWAAYFAT